MTGHFKLTVIQNKLHESKKWFIHNDNIQKPYLYNLASKHLNNDQEFRILFLKERVLQRQSSVLPTDLFRKLNLEEYIFVSRQLKFCKLRYNKKKDILIKK